MTDLLQHFAAVRAPRGREACGCCEASGSHGRETCTRCAGTGFTGAGSDEPWCPSREGDQPAPPRRRHWREPKTAAQDSGPVTINYAHNTEQSPKMGETYGQHVEPHGRYLVEREPGDTYDQDPKWETGSVTFHKPLHMPWGGGYSDPSNWKHELSRQFGGKRGRPLSNAVVRAGHDGIITHGDDGSTREIVDLTSLRHRKQAVSLAELDQHLENWFHPQQLDAAEERHPRSGYNVKVGLERRLDHPKEGPDEAPARFRVTDHGPVGGSLAHWPKHVGYEPIKHVYRGMHMDEWEQAKKQGHIKSDQRGTIAGWEGTNAGVDPGTAVSYLPSRSMGVIAKIRVHPEDKWFSHRVDSYVRTREKIPLDRVEAVSPPITKGGKYGGDIEKIGARVRNFTDWDDALRQMRYRTRKEPLMHRGIAVDLPPDVHDFVHDQFQSRDRQARAIVDHLSGKPLGMHWSTNEQTPRHFADWERKSKKPGSTKVILHAGLPEAKHIETDPGKLSEGGVFGHENASEHEIPMKDGAPVNIKAVTWYGRGNRKRTGHLWGEEHTAVMAPGLRKHKGAHTAADVGDYGIGHRPMEHGAPLHDLAGDSPDADFDSTSYQPPDYLTHPHYYSDTGGGNNPEDREALSQMRRVQGKPEAKVHIYRATHHSAPHEINHGDWVTLSKGYAAKHAYNESGDDKPENQWVVHHAQVAAKHVRDGGGGGYREHGYWGPSIACCGHEKSAVMDMQQKLFDMPHNKPVPAHQARPWYHGTRHRFKPGATLEGGKVNMNQGYGGTPGDHVYYSGRPDVAAEFADSANGPKGREDARPRVYRVEPDESHEADTMEEPEADSWRAKRVRVAEEVPWKKSWLGAREAAADDWDPYQETYEDYTEARKPEVPLPSETEEYWHPEHLYHGTSADLKPGDTVEPGHASNHADTLDKRRQHAYATPRADSAREYADKAAHERGGRPRVYEVHPVHDMMPDPESNHAWGGPQVTPHPEWRSQTGFRVMHEHTAANYRGKFPCKDCGWDTNSAKPGVRTENYVVHNPVWQQAGMDKMGGNLCVGCLEKRLGRQLHSGDFPAVPVNDLSEADGDHAYSWRTDRLKDRIQRTAAFTPHERIFGPTYGLDHRLFDGEHLRPAVREVLMTRLGGVLGPVLGPDWKVLAHVWLAGSQASKWTSPELEGNGDLDVLIGLAHTHARLAAPSLSALTDAEIEKHLNTILQARFNESHWHPPFDPNGSEYDLTGYVNHVSDIRAIKPYAAYDLTDDEWTVKQEDMPDWSAEGFPQGPALFTEARALAAQVRAVLKLPEPFRSQEAARIWDSLHAARGADFSETGLGWQGTGNVLEKFLDQAHGGLIEKLKALKYAPGNSPMALAHGMTTADTGSAHG